MPGKKYVYAWLPVWWLFQFEFFNIAMGRKNRQLNIPAFFCCSFNYFDEKKNKATGVRIIDTNTKAVTEYFARIIFVNASALNSNLILLNSTSNRFPNGLGNDSGVLGKYVGFQNYRGWVNCSTDDFA